MSATSGAWERSCLPQRGAGSSTSFLDIASTMLGTIIPMWCSSLPRAFVHTSTFSEKLTTALADFEMVKQVRGLGLLMGVEFQAPGAAAPADSVPGVRGCPWRNVRADSGDAAVP